MGKDYQELVGSLEAEVEPGCDCDCEACMSCPSIQEELAVEVARSSPVQTTSFPWQPEDVEYELAVARDLFTRKCNRYHNECPEEPGQQIRNILVEQDGNFTIVVLDTAFGPIVGVSKFNPRDVKVIRKEDKRGEYFYHEQSSFDPSVGFIKSLNRAVDKLLEQFII